ncbi:MULTISPECIES: hypothetical protein [Pseudofrankia]|uniref:hypothetical protein n=1 Tax=Pseudofrankia TaxID=2994363 RepID=UPI000234C155|nr:MULTISPECIES: hypothetical protein [Pseudofrankia]OHV28614.1 hypothetical protein BCD49_37800 [Pseudofrankia sp. EUN1h]
MASAQDHLQGSALRIAVRAGWWDLRRLPTEDTPHSVAATLVLSQDGQQPAPASTCSVPELDSGA